MTTHVEFAKLRRGTTVQRPLKRAKIQTSRTRYLVTAAQLVASSERFVNYAVLMSLSSQLYSELDADLRLVVSNL